MAANKLKSYKVDFFVVTHAGKRNHDVMKDLLADADDHTEALSLVDDDEEKFQIRSIEKAGAKVFKGVFGRCRFGEKPLQGTEDGEEADVELKPGHGLVEKNHFLFYSEKNLLVFQRNPSGSHYSRFQHYSNLAAGKPLLFEPLLTSDSYQRLLDGGHVRTLDISFQQPKDPEFYKNLWTKDVVKLIKRAGGVNTRIRIGVGRTTQTLLSDMKEVAVNLAKGGLAKVARVQLEGESTPIDLIADRVIGNIAVKLQENGRPAAEDIYAALQQVRDENNDDIKRFYGG